MPIVPGYGLVRKTNVLVQVPEVDEDSVFGAIESSDGKIGLYGNYDCVISAWPARRNSESCRSIWTFCEETDEEEVRDIIMVSTLKKPMIDFIGGRILMLEKHDSRVRDYAPRKGGNPINAVIDVPWGDMEKTKSYVRKDSEGIGIHKRTGHMATWPADGFFRPLPGSTPRRGRTGKIERVKYLKIWTSYEPECEEGLIKGLMGTLKAYELPVMCFFENAYFLFPYMTCTDELRFYEWGTGE
jgi:hypothetical protein